MSNETPSSQGHGPSQLTVRPRTLIGITLGALVIGTLIVLGAILPAEFHSDPLGIGKLTGIARIWSPPEKKFDVDSSSAPLAREYPTPFRSDTIEIPLTGFLGGANGSELEYKFQMKKGATLIYSWEATGAERANELSYDFHGHTTPAADSKDLMQVATYKQSYGLKQRGALTAPFDGIQGWQFSNGGDTDIVVHLKVSGFYELIPPGETGNEAGIVANVPVEQARPGFKRPDR